MDKYTYSMKAEKIQKLVKKGDYESAVKIADTVDWEEVHSVRLLTITAAAYENTRDYRSAIELLQLAYEESAVGKRILFKLTGLAIADKNLDLAQHYYEMYLQEASDDNGRYLLRYLLAELKKEPLDKRIAILETYRKYEFEEEWALRLAQMYDEAGMGDQCVKLCDEIILWFGVGDYVDEAMALKEKYAPLSAQQQEHRSNREAYAQRYQKVVDEYNEREAVPEEEEEAEEAEPPREEPMESWPAQVLLIEAGNLDEAVPKALEQLAQYYRSQNKPMGKLTRISAERFNQIGFEAGREHTRGKDLLIDSAASISEELLADIVHSIKYEQSEQLFVLADKPDQLAYLDSRLSEFIARDDSVPQIEVSELRAEDVLIRMSETVEDELESSVKTESKKAETPEEKPNLLESEAEQLSFDFDGDSDSPDWAAAAGAVPAADEKPANVTPKPAALQGEPPKAGQTEAIQPQPREEAVSSENPFSFSDFLMDQSAAFQSVGMLDKAEVSLPDLQFEAEEAAVIDEPPEIQPEDLIEETIPEAQPEEAPKEALSELQPEEKKAEDAPPRTDTRQLPLEEIRHAQDSAPKTVSDSQTTVVSEKVKKTVAEADNINLEGATKVVNKVGTTTGSLGAIGMSESDFVTYAKNYLASIDCVLDEAGEMALQNAAEARKEKGVLLTKEEAENMIEEAADLSERKGGLFGKRYNKEGYLILKGKFIQ